METYLLYMLAAAAIGALLAGLARLFWKKGAATFGLATILTALTIMAHQATYAGSSMYAGYNLATPEAIPFFILLSLDLAAAIFGGIRFIKNKTTRKPKTIALIFGLVCGLIIAALTLKFFIELGCRMPWYGG